MRIYNEIFLSFSWRYSDTASDELRIDRTRLKTSMCYRWVKLIPIIDTRIAQFIWSLSLQTSLIYTTSPDIVPWNDFSNFFRLLFWRGRRHVKQHAYSCKIECVYRCYVKDDLRHEWRLIGNTYRYNLLQSVRSLHQNTALVRPKNEATREMRPSSPEVCLLFPFDKLVPDEESNSPWSYFHFLFSMSFPNFLSAIYIIWQT
jgi:hypothetical protein